MAEEAKLFLNKIVEENDVQALDRYNIEIDDMPTDIDRAAYRFIREYAEQNDGQAPSYAVVVANVEGFDYIPEVSDSYQYLAGRIKSLRAKREVLRWFETGEFEKRLNEMDGREFVEKWLPSVLESVKMRTSVRESVGTDIVKDADKFLEEYERRKLGNSFRVWKSKFPAIGEYVSSNLYVVYGKSGRGKSVITLEDALYAATQGANVLIWAMELPEYEVLTRAYVSLSGEVGVTTADYNGMDLTAGFDAYEVRTGRLDDEFERTLKTFVKSLDSYLEGSLTIRAVDHEDFNDRSLRALEADIIETNADFIVIDPFYYLHYERNTSKTAGGDAMETSKKLRSIAGRTSTVIVAITQADEVKEKKDESGFRELKLPAREEVKKTKQLLEDAYQLIAVDTDYKQGRGLVGVNKGRDGGEGDVTEILYIPQIGVVRALETGEEALEQFDF